MHGKDKDILETLDRQAISARIEAKDREFQD
jgi:hypothetical protein